MKCQSFYTKQNLQTNFHSRKGKTKKGYFCLKDVDNSNSNVASLYSDILQKFSFSFYSRKIKKMRFLFLFSDHKICFFDFSFSSRNLRYFFYFSFSSRNWRNYFKIFFLFLKLRKNEDFPQNFLTKFSFSSRNLKNYFEFLFLFSKLEK